MGAHAQGRLPARRVGSCDGFRLVSERGATNDGIRVIPVHKRRVRYTSGECMAELSDLEVDGRPIRTLALESIDPVAVSAQVAALGLQDRVNTSVPRALLS